MLPSVIGGQAAKTVFAQSPIWPFYPTIRSHTKPSPIGLRMKPIRPLTIPYH